MNLLIDKDKIHIGVRLVAGKWLLRPYLTSDREFMFDVYADPQVAYYIGKEPFTDISQADRVIEQMIWRMNNKRGLAWVIIDTETEEIVGHAGLWEIDELHCRTEVGYALLPPYQKKGVMSAVLPVILDYAFNQIRLHSISANTSTDNVGSRKLLERNGFKLEAKFRENFKFQGKFIDSLIYSKLETD